MKKEGTLEEILSPKWLNNHEQFILNSFTKFDVTKSLQKWKSGGERGHAAPPQEQFNFKDPLEVIYHMKKKHQ